GRPPAGHRGRRPVLLRPRGAGAEDLPRPGHAHVAPAHLPAAAEVILAPGRRPQATPGEVRGFVGKEPEDQSAGEQPSPAFPRPGGRGTGGRGATRRRGRGGGPPTPPTPPSLPGPGGASRSLLPHLPAGRPDLIALVMGQSGVPTSEYVR